MSDIIDMIISNESPLQISDEIKNTLFSKSAEKIDVLKPEVGSSMFGGIVNPEEE